MRVGIISVFMDYRRRGAKQRRGILQPGIGPVIAALLPRDIEIDVVNETWHDPDWARDYDLLFLSSLHSDFDRARQISHYWRKRGAKTVYGGTMASTYPGLCQPFFDAVVVGDAEGSVPEIFEDFRSGELKSLYLSTAYDASRIPVPRFDLVADRHMAPISFEATRGCPFACDFCSLTGIGTRFHSRDTEDVVRDIEAGRAMVAGRVSRIQRDGVVFLDNNIGGNPKYLRRLCDAIAPLGVRWMAAITFNALSTPGVIEAMAGSGCKAVFVGLESFNPEALSDMNKFQNALDQTKSLVDRCRKNGMLLESGMMLSPIVDGWDYIQSIPRHLQDAGLYLPVFMSFEGPIPGTPFFRRLAETPQPAFLPNALLRDLTGHTLVTRPLRESPESFVEGYKWALGNTYTTGAKLRKLASDVPRLVAGGGWDAALGDAIVTLMRGDSPNPERSYLAGTDLAPPESTTVPLTDQDFDSETERASIMDPWAVTDAEGFVVPAWTDAVRVYDAKGALSSRALELTGISSGVAAPS